MKSIHSKRSSSLLTRICSVLVEPSSSPGLVDDPLDCLFTSNMVPAASTLPTLMTSLRKRVYETLPPSALWKSRASLRSTRNFCFQGWMKFLLSLTCAQPSFMTATPPWPSTLDVWRPRGRDMVEPLYWVGPVREMGEFRLMLAMLPGRLVLGVRLRRGLSVGGRGAGPGFMNCPEG